MPKLIEAVETFLKLPRADSTTSQYRYVLMALAAAIGPARDVRRITYEDLLDYFDQCHQRGVKPVTVGGYVNITKAFFTFCEKRHYCKHSPAADLPRRYKRTPPDQSRAVPQDDLAKMVRYAQVTSPRNYAMLLFLIDTGCRAGGLCSLTLDSLDTVEMVATLREKGDRLQRVVFGVDTANALMEWLTFRPTPPDGHRYVWTGQGPDYAPLHPDGVRWMIEQTSIKARCSRKWSPHAIRHAVGHAYANAGLPITATQHRLGHASSRITADFYYPNAQPWLDEIHRTHALIALNDSPKDKR